MLLKFTKLATEHTLARVPQPHSHMLCCAACVVSATPSSRRLDEDELGVNESGRRFRTEIGLTAKSGRADIGFTEVPSIKKVASEVIATQRAAVSFQRVES